MIKESRKQTWSELEEKLGLGVESLDLKGKLLFFKEICISWVCQSIVWDVGDCRIYDKKPIDTTIEGITY